MKVYITKYALTSGIIVTDAEILTDGMIRTEEKWNRYFHGEGRDWHRTFEGAQKRAEEMRVKKIASLKKQLVKYEKMYFGEESEVSQ